MFKIWKIFNTLLLISIIVVGCQTNNSVVSTLTPQTIPTDEVKTLTICLGYEPESLYLYGASSQSAWAVLEAIYDGPIDINHYEASPVILTKIPSLENGNVQLRVVDVEAGDAVIDTQGKSSTLVKGINVLPSGCNSLDCAVTWDGNSPLQMDQMIVTYYLIKDIKWSDGQPLTARDSIYSYEIASDYTTPGSRTFLSQTQSYESLDEFSIRWVGKPGFLTNHFENYFWIPLPEHAWSDYSTSELLTTEESARIPIGWGAYILQEWKTGQYIHLIKNPNYFKFHEGLPKFDQLIFKFLNSQGDANIKGIQHGECDFVNQTTLMLDQSDDLDTLLNFYSIPEVNVFFGQGPLIEYILFNTSKAKDTFGAISLASNVQLRQTIAYCLNRSMINKELFDKLAAIPLTYLPPTSPFYMNDLESYQYNSQKGQQILEEMGWMDNDRDATTARIANHATTITDETKLSVRLITTLDEWEEKTAILIKESLLECGFSVDLRLFQEDEFLDSEGPFFQNEFDLALFGWMSGEIPPCYLFSRPAQEILFSDRLTIDLDVSRYNNPEFDVLCKASLQPLVTEEEQKKLQQEMQTILNRDLPFLPLFTYFQADVARNDFCPFELDISARSDLQNIESMDYGEHCQP